MFELCGIFWCLASAIREIKEGLFGQEGIVMEAYL